MDSTAHDLQQPNIYRALEYRPLLRWTYFILLGSALPVGVLGGMYASLLYDQQRMGAAAAIAVFSITIPLTNLLFAWLWLKPLAFTKVHVSNQGVILSRNGESIEVPFFRVAGLHFSFLPYLGGWFVLRMHDGRRFRFTAALERCDYLLDALAIGHPTLMPTAELARYRRICIVIDHVFARIQATLADWPSLMAMQVGLPLVLTAGAFMALSANDVSEAPMVFAAIGLLNSIVGLLLWVAKEFIEIRRKDRELIENPLNPLRDMAREKKEKFYSRLIHVAAVSALIAWICTA